MTWASFAQVGSALILLLLLGGAFSPVAQQPPDIKKDIIFLVDVSSSTCPRADVGKVPWCPQAGTDPEGVRLPFIRLAGAEIRRRCSDCRFAVITFSATAQTTIGLEDEWRPDRLELGVSPGTDFRAAFRAALAEFTRAKTWESGKEAVIVLVSDGIPSMPDLSAEEIIQESAALLRDSKGPVYLYVCYLHKEEDWNPWLRDTYFSGILQDENFFRIVTPLQAAQNLADRLVPLSPVVPTPSQLGTLEPALTVRLVSPRQAFIPSWTPIVCPVSGPAVRLLGGTIILNARNGGEVSLPLAPRPSDSCLEGPTLSEDFSPGTYSALLAGIRYEWGDLKVSLPEIEEGEIQLLSPVSVKVRAPLRIYVREAPQLWVEIQNGRTLLVSETLPVVLYLNERELRSEEWQQVDFQTGQPGPDDVTIGIQLSKKLFTRPGEAHLEIYLDVPTLPDGLPIPPAWRRQEVRFEVISPWERTSRRIGGFLAALLSLLLLLILAWRYQPELATSYAMISRSPEAYHLATRVWNREESRHRDRFRARMASLLTRFFNIAQGRRGGLYQRLFYLANVSETLREALAFGLSRRWSEQPARFLEEANVLARQIPPDLFLFAALSPLFKSRSPLIRTIHLDEPADLAREESVYDQARRLALLRDPAIARRTDLEFIKNARQYGVQVLRDPSLRPPWIISGDKDLSYLVGAQIGRNPILLLSLIYYEMDEGFAPDVAPQDRPRVEEILRNAREILDRLPDDPYRASAVKFLEFLQQVWETRTVPAIQPEAFAPFLPDPARVVNLLRDAIRSPTTPGARRENRRRLEEIDPPFRMLVGHMLESWEVI